MDQTSSGLPLTATFPQGIGGSQFTKGLEALHQHVEADGNARHLLQTRLNGTTRILQDFAAGRRHDGSYRLRHFYWSAQHFSDSETAARTLVYNRKDDAPTWVDFPQDADLPTIIDVLAKYPPTRCLRYIPLRRLTYAALTDAGMPIVIKVKRKDRITEAAQRLNHVGLLRSESGAGFLIPKMLSHEPDLACMSQSFVQGELLQSSVGNRNSDEFRKLGAALHDLHSLDIAGLPLVTDEHVRSAALETVDWLDFMIPQFSASFATIRKHLLGYQVMCAHVALCHGDFNASQLIYDGAHWTFLDFDRVHAGNPFIDIANFSTKLHRDPPDGLEQGLLESLLSDLTFGYECAAEARINARSLAFHISCSEIHHLQQMLKKGQYFARALDSALERIHRALEASLA